MDACLLTAFISAGKPIRFCVEFGFGTGLLGIGLVAAGCVENLTGVEIQTDLFNLGVQNIVENGFEEKIRILNEDLRTAVLSNRLEKVDAIVMNPPFWAVNESKIPENIQRRIAGFEIYGTLMEWISAGAKILKNKRSRIFLVYPALKVGICFAALSKLKMYPVRMRFVHPLRNSVGELVLVEVRRGDDGCALVEPPLYLKNSKGSNTAASQKILNGQFTRNLSKMKDKR